MEVMVVNKFGEGSIEKLLRKRMTQIHEDLQQGEPNEESNTGENDKLALVGREEAREAAEPEGAATNPRPGNEECAETQKKSSWAEMLGRTSVGKKDLSYIPPSIIDGKAVVHVQSNHFDHVKKKYEKLVVGSFVGKKPVFLYVRDVLSRTWRTKGKFNMRTYGDNMFTFEFASEEDRDSVLDKGSFHIASQLFVVRPWKLFVEAESKELKTIPIWIIMKNFPLEMWDTKGFSQVGSAIGIPMFTDKPTEDMTRTTYARLCVEVSVDCKFQKEVPVVIDQVRAISIPIEYNWKPPLCSRCKVFGHTDAKCAKNTKEDKEQPKVWLKKGTESQKEVQEAPQGTKTHSGEGTREQEVHEVVTIEKENEGWESPAPRHSVKARTEHRMPDKEQQGSEGGVNTRVASENEMVVLTGTKDSVVSTLDTSKNPKPHIEGKEARVQTTHATTQIKHQTTSSGSSGNVHKSGQLTRQLYERMRRETGCLKIQKYWRMYHLRKTYRTLHFSAVTIQTGMRVMTARNDLRFRRQTRAAIIIQSQWRRYLARLHFLRIKKAAITAQCAWRGRVARKELRQLKLAARETGALQAAKNKLEKQVEELTWRLQLEKRMRSDMEEAKIQENAKLQSALQDMQIQCKETKALLATEREAAKRLVEQVPVTQEIPVIDTAILDKLTVENEKLKDLVGSLEKKVDETERKYEETNKLCEERLKQALDAESSKIIQLKTYMRSLDEKLLDMESENQILRKQALLTTPVKRMSEHLAIPTAKNLANGHHDVNEIASEPQSATPANKYGSESENMLRRSHVEGEHENVDALIKCVMQDIGFSQGKPAAAFTIYKCLLYWKSFEAKKTSVFDRLIQMIGSAIENQENNDHMAYWLSNTSALLFLLQKSLRASGTTGSTPNRKPPQATSLFGRMTQGFRSSPSSANLSFTGVDIVRQVEAKYPALLFKKQLTAYVEKIYGIIRDNLKKELTPSLSSCIQAPRTSKGSALRGSGRSFGNSSPTSHWRTIIESLKSLLSTLQQNFVPPVLIRKIFTQIFSYINVQLFNSLLLRRECCTFSNGEYVKSGLAELELWCCQSKEEYAGSSWDELKHIRQAVGFLVIHQKSRISYDEIINDLCPILSVQQLYRICTLYWDDKYNTRSVSQDVISNMRVLMTEDSNNAESNSFLLDDNPSIPFSADDISTSLKEKDFSDVKPATELLENPAFQFLQE